MRHDKWINEAGEEVIELNGDGRFTPANPFSNAARAVTVYLARGSGGDPSGATVKVATGAFPGRTPVDVTGASATLGSLSATDQVAIPVRSLPAGNFFLVVSGYTNPIAAVGID